MRDAMLTVSPQMSKANLRLRELGYFCPSPKKEKLVERFAWRDLGGLVPKG